MAPTGRPRVARLDGPPAVAVSFAVAALLGCSAAPAPASPAGTPTSAPTVSPEATPTATPTGTQTASPVPNPSVTAAPTAAPPQIAGTWQALAQPVGIDVDEFMEGAAFLGDGRAVVLATNVVGPHYTNIYRPARDVWEQSPPPTWDRPAEVADLFRVVVGLSDGDAMAVLSWHDQNQKVGAQFSRFDGAGTEGWNKPADLDEPFIVTGGVGLADGRLMIFGDGQQVRIFDPTDGSWTTPEIAPFAIDRAVTLDDGTVLASSAGGHSASLSTDTGSWTFLPDIGVGDNPQLAPISGGAMALGGTVFGFNDIISQPQTRTAYFGSDVQSWLPGPDLPSIDDGGPGGLTPVCVRLADGRLLAAGGFAGGTDYSAVNGGAILASDRSGWTPISEAPNYFLQGIGRLLDDGSVLMVVEGLDPESGGIILKALRFTP